MTPSPRGAKDLAGFALTPHNTQVKKKQHTEQQVGIMFPEEEDSLDVSLDISPQSSSEAFLPPTLEFRSSPSKWRLATGPAGPSQYKTSLLVRSIQFQRLVNSSP